MQIHENERIIHRDIREEMEESFLACSIGVLPLTSTW